MTAARSYAPLRFPEKYEGIVTQTVRHLLSDPSRTICPACLGTIKLTAEVSRSYLSPEIEFAAQCHGSTERHAIPIEVLEYHRDGIVDDFDDWLETVFEADRHPDVMELLRWSREPSWLTASPARTRRNPNRRSNVHR